MVRSELTEIHKTPFVHLPSDTTLPMKTTASLLAACALLPVSVSATPVNNPQPTVSRAIPSSKPQGPVAVSQGTLTEFVKQFEGWNPRPYKDYKQRSIGYGTKAKKGDKQITKEEGERRLGQELARHRQRVLNHRQRYGYNWSEKQVNALTSFDYNTGALEQLTNKGTRNNAQIAEKMPLYRKSGGKVLRGLVKRRNKEAQMFIEGSGLDDDIEVARAFAKRQAPVIQAQL